MTHPELSGQARELTELLADLVDCIGSEDQERICCHDISISEYRALRVLREEGAPAMQALAERLEVTKGGATRIVDRLEAKGYARRERDAEDGRVCCVVATTEADSLLGRIERERIGRGQAVMRRIDPPLREHVLDALRLLRRATRRAATPVNEATCC